MPDRHLPAPAGDWFRITNAAKARTARVDIYDAIGWDESAKDFVGKINALDVDQIDLHLNSPGGDAYDGIAILNALRDHPARVVATVDGMAASAASFIAMAGDEVVMNRNSELMIHDAAGLAVGNSETMKDLAGRLDKMSDNIASIYAERAGGTVPDWRKAMRAETWYSAQEAVDAGLADRVAAKADPKAEAVKAHFDVSVFNYAGRAEAPAPALPAAVSAVRTQTPEPAGPGTTTEGGAVADNAKLREALGLQADASDDDIRGALVTAGFAAQPAAPANSATTTATTAPPVSPAGTTPPAETDAAADQRLTANAAKSGVVTMDASQVANFQEGMKRAEALARQLDERQRDESITNAIKAGKFPPARRAHYERLWNADAEGTKQVIDSLAAGLVPVTATGYAGDGADAMWDAEFAGMFPPSGQGR